MRLLAAALLAALAASLPALPAAAQEDVQLASTEKGTLDVELAVPSGISPGDTVRMGIDFINPVTGRVQEHIDYRVTVLKDGGAVFGPIPLTHTSEGSVGIPVELADEGTYAALIEVEGILFQPIPPETVSFAIAVGEAAAQGPGQEAGGGGGCLVATAAHGTEAAQQVQRLREVRDTAVAGTASGAAFMGAFGQIYYSFSPAVADLEREHPMAREAARAALAPLLAALAPLEHAGIETEAGMVAYGMAVLALAAGTYGGVPAVAILGLRRRAGRRGAEGGLYGARC